MPTWVCLLRGINVGAHNRVSMADLRDGLAGRGYPEVRTHLQSGNVVLTTRHRTEHGIAELVHDTVLAVADVDVPVIARRDDALAAVVAAHPWPDPDPKLTMVAFLADRPDGNGVDDLHDQTFGADRCRVVGREVHLAYDTSSHDSPLSLALLTRRLGVDGTVRNWRTVTTLADLSA